MPYRIAGIDVHKRMLAVVVADVAVDGEYQFERRHGRHVAGAVAAAGRVVRRAGRGRSGDGIDRAVLAAGVGHAGAVLAAAAATQRRTPAPTAGTLHLAQAQSNRGPRGPEEGFPRCRAIGETVGRRRTDAELRARCRAAVVAHGDAPQVSTDL